MAKVRRTNYSHDFVTASQVSTGTLVEVNGVVCITVNMIKPEDLGCGSSKRFVELQTGHPFNLEKIGLLIPDGETLELTQSLGLTHNS